MKEASEDMWSVRTLERNITTQYYGRRLASQREHLPLPAPTVVDKSSPEAYINMAYMPTEEELRKEIEQQKRFFLEQHENR